MILIINSGSSNTKYALYDPQTLNQVQRGQVKDVQEVFAWLQQQQNQFKITSVGHRIVHGGTEYFAPVLLTDNIMQELKKLIPLAPLHQPYNLAAVEYIKQEYPGITQVGCFDTAFHRSNNKIAQLYAIPDHYTEDGIIKYGFHGLSYEYIASVLEQYVGEKAGARVIVAHLGNGASMCAMNGLRSVATTMGFSALDGLMMGTRCGAIDPGVLLYLMQEQNYNPDSLSKFLYNECGLLGVSNVTNDMQKLLASTDPAAQRAIDLFCYRAATELGKLLVNIGGCDVLVFTAGIGERASKIRASICKWLEWLGLKLDSAANDNNTNIISTPDSKVMVAVIPTNEEYIIAKHVKNLVK